ncbi:TPA: helix-turn-helix transcriptional regulator [Salmonella enterica subsp. houtenae]|nr:helix-turn-helix transcriptional regulator [Salmonella enterica subsp. houtenae]
MKSSVCDYILLWVEVNLLTNENIDCLVKGTGYSRKTLEQWFYNKYSILPAEYLYRRRMSRAVLYLKFTNMTITEIADIFHYHSNQNFARAIKKYTGKSPTEYRKDSVWDCSFLQRPLLYPEVINRGERCYLPDLKLEGVQHECRDSIFIEESQAVVTKSIFDVMNDNYYALRIMNKKEVWVAANVLATKKIDSSRLGLVDIQLFVGQVDNKNMSVHLYPAGYYMKFHFSGDKDKYRIFSRLIYIDVLASGKVKKRNAPDLIKILHIEHNDINCEIYIPVM